MLAVPANVWLPPGAHTGGPQNSTLEVPFSTRLPPCVPPPPSVKVDGVFSVTVPLLLNGTNRRVKLVPADLTRLPALLNAPELPPSKNDRSLWMSIEPPTGLLMIAPFCICMLPPVRVAAPALIQVRPSSTLVELPLSVVAPFVVSVFDPVPETVPDVQLKPPFAVTFPAPASVPPESVSAPPIVDGASRLRLPPESVRSSFVVMECAACVPLLTVIVATVPGTSMTTSSLAVGTAPRPQFAGSSQAADTPPLQVLTNAVNGSVKLVLP